MKVFFLKKTFFIITIILLIIFFSTLHLILNTKENNEINNIDIKEPTEFNNYNEIQNNNSDGFLKKQYENKKLVVLTFDDGPSKYTSSLIDELKKREVPATFFVLGSEVSKYPEILKFSFDTRNEIGIHSFEHKLFTKLTEEEMLEQIRKTKDIIQNVINITPTLIRVPYGSTNKQIKKVLNETNLINVLWNVDSLDWKLKDTQKTYNYVMKKIKGNDIILMHDTFKTSVEAATLIIDKLQSEGYTFVTVSEFFRIKNSVNN